MSKLKETLTRLLQYADPVYLRWLLILLSLVALVLGVGAPEEWGPGGGPRP